MSNEKDPLEPPENSIVDDAHLAVKAGLSAVTLGLGGEAFARIVQAPMERKLWSWREEVGIRIKRLEDEKRIDPEELAENEAFIQAAGHATTIALRNLNQDKRRRLRNAVLNSALKGALDLDDQQVFMRFIDELNEHQLQMLKAVSSQEVPPGRNRYVDRSGVTIWDVMTSNGLDLSGNKGRCARLWKDLHDRALVDSADIDQHLISGRYPKDMYKRSTPFGDEFLAYIESPFDDERGSGGD